MVHCPCSQPGTLTGVDTVIVDLEVLLRGWGWEVKDFGWRFHRDDVEEARYHECALMWRPVVESMDHTIIVNPQGGRNRTGIQDVPLL